MFVLTGQPCHDQDNQYHVTCHPQTWDESQYFQQELISSSAYFYRTSRRSNDQKRPEE